MNRFIINGLSLLSLSMVAATSLVAQESTGQILGSVRTKAGEPVAGAEVRFTSSVLQGVRVVVTDASGAFRAPLLPPGSYAITATKAGFIGSKVEGAILPLGQVLRQDLFMAPVQQANAMVEVIANAAAVDKTDVKAATNVSSEQMDVLPRFTYIASRWADHRQPVLA
jgi:Carboxypeptidase regulatory-like domain